MGARVRLAAAVLAVPALAGLVIEGLVAGLTFGAMLRWATIWVAGVLATAALLTALSAYRGADRAQRRGERLAGSDVGLVPPRRPRDED